MRYYLVSPLKITHAREATLTYASSEKLQTGQLVAVEVGKNTVPAVITGSTKKPDFPTKEISSLIDEQPLPKPLIELHAWLSSYYVSHPVAVWRNMLPSGLLKTRRPSKTPASPIAKRDQQNIKLNPEQTKAVNGIWQSDGGTSLLHGVTGSGKTAVYIELAKKTVAAGRSVIVLVPEIALTSQLIAEFMPYFKDVSLTHSTMTEAARHSLWLKLLHASTPQVVIGPRSALFMPVPNLGLIVIDECHEPAFKQEQAPRYSALRAASILARSAGARLVLGSATPDISDYYLAEKTNSPIFSLNQPARHNYSAPNIKLIDMTKKLNFTRSSFLSNDLLEKITSTLSAGHQVLIFHNRRGSAPMTLCENCGWSAACPRCFIPLTLHSDDYHLRCHLCNHHETVPLSCPSCQQTAIAHKGIGTKRVYEELAKFFPSANIIRFDGDSKESVESHYQSLYDGQVDIIVGTQVIAKGLDLPHLRLVGVVQADSGLAMPDFKSSERVFQLLTQVAGRVGRNEHLSNVVIQSYQPTHPSITFGLAQDYHGFYRWCLEERKRANFPPFTYLLRLTAVYKTEPGAVRASRELVTNLRAFAGKSVEIIGPAPAFYERIRDTYRWQVIVKSPSRERLLQLIELLPPKGWQSELDPMSLL